MNVFPTVVYLGAFLVFIGMPEGIVGDPDATPGPHEVYDSCHSCHIESCTGTYHLHPIDCDYVFCWSGNICEPGYIREYQNGPCVLRSECPSRGNH